MVSASFTGQDDLIARMGALSVELRRSALVEAVQAGAEPIRARIAELAPAGPDAPHIKDNIGISLVRKVDGVAVGDGSAAVAIGPTKGYFYGIFHEFGWKFHPSAKPFTRSGFEQTKDQALTIVGRELWAAVSSGLKP
jgi:HK97 gp10 family phage protein